MINKKIINSVKAPRQNAVVMMMMMMRRRKADHHWSRVCPLCVPGLPCGRWCPLAPFSWSWRRNHPRINRTSAPSAPYFTLRNACERKTRFSVLTIRTDIRNSVRRTLANSGRLDNADWAEWNQCYWHIRSTMTASVVLFVNVTLDVIVPFGCYR